MINGLQIMTSRLLDARRTVIIAPSVIAGLAVEVFPYAGNRKHCASATNERR